MIISNEYFSNQNVVNMNLRHSQQKRRKNNQWHLLSWLCHDPMSSAWRMGNLASLAVCSDRLHILIPHPVSSTELLVLTWGCCPYSPVLGLRNCPFSLGEIRPRWDLVACGPQQAHRLCFINLSQWLKVRRFQMKMSISLLFWKFKTRQQWACILTRQQRDEARMHCPC